MGDGATTRNKWAANSDPIGWGQMKRFFDLTLVPEYTIVTQHWGIMVGLIGEFMIATALKVEWRKPILI
jgi:hypothetical protein